LDHDGIIPNYIVPITDAQIAAGQDPQMAKAVQVVQAEINGTLSSVSTSTPVTATTTSVGGQ
jgi:hypothetical protein